MEWRRVLDLWVMGGSLPRNFIDAVVQTKPPATGASTTITFRGVGISYLRDSSQVASSLRAECRAQSVGAWACC